MSWKERKVRIKIQQRKYLAMSDNENAIYQ